MNAFTRKALNYYKTRQKKSKWQVYASHASFYVMISAIPALMLLVMFFTRLSQTGAQSVIETIKSHIPSQLADYIPEDFISNAMTASFPIASVTVFLMLWSSSRGMRAISEGLRSVYGAVEEEPIYKRYLDAFALTLVFFAVLLVALILLVFGETISQTLHSVKSRFFDLSRIITRLGWLLSFVLFTFAFSFMYKFMAGRRFPLRKHLPGAALASLGWLMYSLLMSLYLRFFSPEKYLLYGSLGALLLLMLWVRSCMAIFFFGAEVNVMLLYRPLVIGGKRKAGISEQKKEKGGKGGKE